MRVHFVRHTAVDVPRGMCYGQTDVPLRASFEEEAAVVLSKVEKLSHEKVYTSPLSRCTRLAAYCGFPDAERDLRLLEMSFGEWEGLFLYEMVDVPEVQWWFGDQLGRDTPGGESIHKLRDRLLGFLREKQAAGEDNLLVFAHGGIQLSAEIILGKVVEGDPYAHLHPYGSVLTLEFDKF